MSAERFDFGGASPAQEQHQVELSLAGELWSDCFSGKSARSAEPSDLNRVLGSRAEDAAKSQASVDPFLILGVLSPEFAVTDQTQNAANREILASSRNSDLANFIFDSNRILAGVISSREDR
jgi:hypothetical protein